MLQPSVKSAAAELSLLFALQSVSSADVGITEEGGFWPQCLFSLFFFFFNKQYIRENSESPEIGVEVRNISFKCSLTSTRSASLRTALWRGALQQTSQQAARQELELRKLLISTEDHHGTFKHVVTPYVLGGLWVGKLGFNLGSLQMKPLKIAGMVWVCL